MMASGFLGEFEAGGVGGTIVDRWRAKSCAYFCDMACTCIVRIVDEFDHYYDDNIPQKCKARLAGLYEDVCVF